MNGAKGKGYVTSVLNTDAGQSAFVRSCNLIGDLMPLYKSESLGIILQQLWEIMEDCPDLFPPDDPSLTALPTPEEQLTYARGVLANPALRTQMVALFYDDAYGHIPRPCPLVYVDGPTSRAAAFLRRCHLLYSVMLRAVGRMATGLPTDSEAAVFYRRLLRLIICVDRIHFKVSALSGRGGAEMNLHPCHPFATQNHLKTDKFCQETTNPELYDELLKEGHRHENSEAAEQTFR